MVLPVGVSVSDDGVLSGVPTEAGIYPAHVRVIDAAGDVAERDIDIVVEPIDLDRAVAYWRAADYSGSGDLIDQSANSHNLVPGAGTAAPTFLSYTGTPYVYLPGVADNYISTPDHASISLAGDVDVRMSLTLDNWMPVAVQDIYDKWGSSSANKAIAVSLETNGSIRCYLSFDGTTGVAPAASSILGFANGSTNWLRVTRIASTGAIAYYSSVDGNIWIPQGTATSTAGPLFASTAALTVGAKADGSAPMAGKVHYADFRTTIDGAVVAEFNAAACSQTNYTDSTGKVWTIQRSASGLKSVFVDRPLFLFGTNDEMETPHHSDLDFSADQSFTVVVAFRRHGIPAADQVLIAKKVGTGGNTSNEGWVAFMEAAGTVRMRLVEDNVVTVTAAAPLAPSGVLSAFASVRDKTAGTITSWVNGVTNSAVSDPTLSVESPHSLRIGNTSSGSSAHANFEFFGAAVFRCPLTSDEITTVSSLLMGVDV